MSEQQTATLPVLEQEEQADQPWIWNIVLHDSDIHTYEYVIELATTVFAKSAKDALRVAKAVDSDGRAVIMQAHRELAELKLEQIKTFGADPRIPECSTAMRAHIEPAS